MPNRSERRKEFHYCKSCGTKCWTKKHPERNGKCFFCVGGRAPNEQKALDKLEKKFK